MYLNSLVPNGTTLVILSLLILLCYIYINMIHSYWKRRGIPYEKPYLLTGSLWNVFSGKRQIGKHFGDLYRKFDGPYFGIYICGKPYLVIRSPDIVKDITVRDFSNFEDRTFACDKNADDMTGNSLFILRNPEWRNVRMKLTNIFTSGKIKQMFPLMLQTADDLQHYVEKHDNEIVDVKDLAGKYMTDLVAKCFFGIDSCSFVEKPVTHFRKVCIDILDVNIFRSFCMFCYLFLPKLVSLLKLKLLDTHYLRKVFMETLSFREKTGFHRNDFVDLLINIRNTFANTEESTFDTTSMVSQAITFFIAGFETTSNLVGFTLYELSMHPECQDMLRREIFEVFPDETTPLTFDNVHQLKYLNMVIAETLRRYPFGPFLNRNCKKDYVISQTGFKIEKGTPVLVSLDGIHYDPTYYKNPEKFDPERFRAGYKHLLSACTYLPFGMGPRSCIGDRFAQVCARVGIICILKRFTVEKCHLTPDPLVLNPRSPFMQPVNGLQLKIRKL
ncbi:hypothetical protein YQE_06277, partial [Dendroctonus ponderosae]